MKKVFAMRFDMAGRALGSCSSGSILNGEGHESIRHAAPRASCGVLSIIRWTCFRIQVISDRAMPLP